MTRFVLGGSVESIDGLIRGAIFEGSHEWDLQNNKTIRYVEGPIETMNADDTVFTFLSRIYDNSEGCLTKGTFCLKV